MNILQKIKLGFSTLRKIIISKHPLLNKRDFKLDIGNRFIFLLPDKGEEIKKDTIKGLIKGDIIKARTKQETSFLFQFFYKLTLFITNIKYNSYLLRVLDSINDRNYFFKYNVLFDTTNQIYYSTNVYGNEFFAYDLKHAEIRMGTNTLDSYNTDIDTFLSLDKGDIEIEKIKDIMFRIDNLNTEDKIIDHENEILVRNKDNDLLPYKSIPIEESKPIIDKAKKILSDDIKEYRSKKKVIKKNNKADDAMVSEKKAKPTRPLKEGVHKNSQIKPETERPRSSVPPPPPAKPKSKVKPSKPKTITKTSKKVEKPR